MSEQTKTPREVAALVAEQMGRIADPLLRDELKGYLVEPFVQTRKWDYSLTGERLPCWIVADFRERDAALAYSEHGHGARGDCWGVVSLSEDYFGRDDSWFLRLEDAYIASGFCRQPLPDDYEVP